MLPTVVLFLVGAVLGTLGDQIHVRFGVLFYPRPFLFGQAFWVPLLFGGSAPLMVYGHAVIHALAKGGASAVRPPRTAVLLPGILFFAAYFSTGLFAAWPIALAAGLTLAWIARVGWIARRGEVTAGELLLGGVAMAAGGTLVEALVSWTGAFYYQTPDFMGVPVWLPALYLHLALMTRTIYFAFLAPAGAGAAREDSRATSP